MDTIVSYYNAFAEYEANFKGQVRIGCVAWLSHRDARDLNNARQISRSSHSYFIFSRTEEDDLFAILVCFFFPLSLLPLFQTGVLQSPAQVYSAALPSSTTPAATAQRGGATCSWHKVHILCVCLQTSLIPFGMSLHIKKTPQNEWQLVRDHRDPTYNPRR